MDKTDERIKQRIIEYYLELKTFNTVDDIPLIPLVDKDTYDTIIIPNLIRCGAIPKKDLVIGCEYIGECRNSNVAKWDGKTFIYTRYKWGSSYEDHINHFEDDDGYDVFVPIKVKQ